MPLELDFDMLILLDDMEPYMLLVNLRPVSPDFPLRFDRPLAILWTYNLNMAMPRDLSLIHI